MHCLHRCCAIRRLTALPVTDEKRGCFSPVWVAGFVLAFVCPLAKAEFAIPSAGRAGFTAGRLGTLREISGCSVTLRQPV